MQITINGEKIAKEVCEQEIQNQKRHYPQLSDEQVKRMAADSITDWTLIRQHAKESITSIPNVLIDGEYEKLIKQHGDEEKFKQQFGLSDEDIPKVKADLETNIKVNQFLQQLTVDLPDPSEEDLQKYYDENPEAFTEPEQVHAAHIVMRPNPSDPATAYKEMMDIRGQLMDGADFADMANEHSSCQDQGGDLGWFAPGKMVQEFDTIIFSMNSGEISPIFQTQFGYHIATVFEKKEPQLKPFDDVKDTILDQIKTNRGDDFIGQWVDDVKDKADIDISLE